MSEENLDQSYLDSKYFIDPYVYNCPFCNRRNVSYGPTGYLEFDWSTEKRCHVYIAECFSCNRKSMHLSDDDLLGERVHLGGGGYGWRFTEEVADIDSHIFYSAPTSFFTVDKRIPKIIRELITEAEDSLKMNYLTGASAWVRKAIYELLVHEEIEGETYEDRIKSLKGKYPLINPELFDVLGHIQQMASDKVHEQSWDKWDSPNLKLITETLKIILHKIYVLPDEDKQQTNRIQQLRQEALKKPSQS